MASEAYYVGQRVLVEGRFRLRGVHTDPTVVQCIARAPGGSRTTLVYPHESLTRYETGWYEANFNADVAGVWRFRWEGAGVVDAVGEVAVLVQASDVIDTVS